LPEKALAVTPLGGFTSNAECLAAVSAVVKQSGLTIINPMTLGLSREISLRYSCLPDTVDPRGPKAK
jgi:hypothetical protein